MSKARLGEKMKSAPYLLMLSSVVTAGVALGIFLYTTSDDNDVGGDGSNITIAGQSETGSGSSSSSSAASVPADKAVSAENTETGASATANAASSAGDTASAASSAGDTAPAEAISGEATIDTEIGINLARVRQDGTTVIAGQALPESTVNLMRDGDIIGTTSANQAGEWVVVPDLLLEPGSHLLSVEIITPDGTRLIGPMAVVIDMPAGSDEAPLVALVPFTAEAETVARVLQAPDEETVLAGVDASSSSSSTESTSISGTAASAGTSSASTGTVASTTGATATVQSSSSTVAAASASTGTAASTAGATATVQSSSSTVAAASASTGTVQPSSSTASASGTAAPAAGSSTAAPLAVLPSVQIRTIQALSADRLAVGGTSSGGVTATLTLNGVDTEASLDAGGMFSATTRIDPAQENFRLRVVLKGKDNEVLAQARLRLTRGQIQQSLGNNSLVVVHRGDALWRIAYRSYGEGIRYVDIYRKNQQQIDDPDLIYPDQIFVVPNS